MPPRESAEMKEAIRLTQPPQSMSVAAAAAQTGVNRQALHQALKRHQLSGPGKKGPVKKDLDMSH